MVIDTAGDDDPVAGSLLLKVRYGLVQRVSALEMPRRVGICAVVSPGPSKKLAPDVFS
jgi:hypothetical protein